jgi:hypothetical protein
VSRARCPVSAALCDHEHPWPSSPRCSLGGRRIGDAGAAALSEALKRNATLTSLVYVARPALCRRPVSPRASLTLLSSLQLVVQPDRRRGHRGALGGAQDQRDSEVARVSRARPALCRRPCLATSIPNLPFSLLQIVEQPDRRGGRRGALGGAQDQRDADVAQVSRARPALCWRPCLATSIPDPPFFASVCTAARSARRAPRRSRRRSRSTRR